MTKAEIQALIDAKIAGQGSAVDVGGALPEILSGILEMAASGANVQSDWNQTDSDEADYIKNKPAIPSRPAVVEIDSVFEEVSVEEALGSILVGRSTCGSYQELVEAIEIGAVLEVPHLKTHYLITSINDNGIGVFTAMGGTFVPNEAGAAFYLYIDNINDTATFKIFEI